jgi:hypothetical protein
LRGIFGAKDVNTTHTHDRYKIDIDGERVSVFVGSVRVICQRLDVYTVGAIRQQARDIAELLAALILALDEIRECDDTSGVRAKITAALAKASGQ